MKRLNLVTAVLLALSTTLIAQPPQPPLKLVKPNPNPRSIQLANEPVRQLVNFPSKNMTVPDYLLRLAQEAKINIIANTTHLPDKAIVDSQSNGNALTLAVRFSQSHQSTLFQFDEKTLLLYPEVPLAEALRQLANANENPILKLSPMVKEANEYLKTEGRQWLEKQDAEKKPVKFAELSPQFQAALLTSRVEFGSNPAFSDYVLHLRMLPNWTKDEFWQKVRVKSMPWAQTNSDLFLVGETSSPWGLTRMALGINRPRSQTTLLQPKIASAVNGEETPGITTLRQEKGEARPLGELKSFSSALANWDSDSMRAQLHHPALQKPCSLTLQKVSLPTVLQEVQKQCGVRMQVGNGNDAALNAQLLLMRITLRVHEMTAQELLMAVARLTGGKWSANDKGEYLLNAVATPFQMMMLQVANPVQEHFYRWRDWTSPGFKARTEKRKTLEGELRAQMLKDKVVPEQGIAWSELSAGQRAALRTLVAESQVKLQLTKLFTFERLISEGHVTLSRKVEEKAAGFFPFEVQRADHFVLPLEKSKYSNIYILIQDAQGGTLYQVPVKSEEILLQ